MAAPDDRPLISRSSLELFMAALLLAIAAALMVDAVPIGIGWGVTGPQPGQVPFIGASILALSSIGIGVQALRAKRISDRVFLRREEARRVATLLLPLLAYVVMVYLLGFYAPTLCYIAGVMVWQGRYSLRLSGLVACLTVVALYTIFEIWFQIELLKGPIEIWLGLA